ncbi:dienelactone hydrolase family protein [Actinomadura madurae]|uniref:dienelactone hydrolase family protein n=1 Tax=Actinomadura madurae TaxID=1993 RepID=UPI00399A5A0E
MEEKVRVQPRSTEVVLGERTVPIHTLWLGGIPRGAVLILLDADSTDYDRTEAMNKVAAHGYESVAATHLRDSKAEWGDTLVDVLVTRLAERGWSEEQIGIVGFGTGGSAALFAAGRVPLGGAVSVAPTGMPALLMEGDRVSRLSLRAPWLGLLASGDGPASGEWPVVLTSALMSRTRVYSEVVQYPDVGEDFYRDSHEPPVHAAAFDSWQRIIEWLDAMVAPRPTPLATAWRLRYAASVH